MLHDNNKARLVPSKMMLKATGELQKEVEKELKAEDPETEKAISILKGEQDHCEDSEGNDREAGDTDDTEGSE